MFPFTFLDLKVSLPTTLLSPIERMSQRTLTPPGDRQPFILPLLPSPSPRPIPGSTHTVRLPYPQYEIDRIVQ